MTTEHPADHPATPTLLLRREVAALRARETRRVFDAAVSVGVLGGERDSFVARAADRELLDAALRVDVVCGLLEDADPAWRTAWLTRAGEVDPHDMDVAWASAARRAFAIQDRPLQAFYVITRYGWRDVVSGEQRSWKRLRTRTTS